MYQYPGQGGLQPQQTGYYAPPVGNTGTPQGAPYSGQYVQPQQTGFYQQSYGLPQQPAVAQPVQPVQPVQSQPTQSNAGPFKIPAGMFEHILKLPS
jgi:hypothetical protein